MEAVPALLALLRDSEINWRSHLAAIDALVEIGEPAAAWLLPAFKFGEPQLRYECAMALKFIDQTPKYRTEIEEELARRQRE